MIVVRVTNHALQQARARDPETFNGALSNAEASARIRADVADAIAAGRMAANQPRWACDAEHGRADARKIRKRRQRGRQFDSSQASAAGRHLAERRQPNPSVRYVWPEDETRLYVVKRGTANVVITTLGGRVQETVAA